MGRKPNALLPLEISILESATDLKRGGVEEFHGFGIAKEIRDREGARLLAAHGTLYRALGRMEKAGLLVSQWEDPIWAASEKRRRRHTYRVTPAGEGALSRAKSILTCFHEHYVTPCWWCPRRSTG